jgi:hypothetical protein
MLQQAQGVWDTSRDEQPQSSSLHHSISRSVLSFRFFSSTFFIPKSGNAFSGPSAMTDGAVSPLTPTAVMESSDGGDNAVIEVSDDDDAMTEISEEDDYYDDYVRDS